MTEPYIGRMGWSGEHNIVMGFSFDGPHDQTPKQLPGLRQEEKEEVTETDDNTVSTQDD